MWTIWSSFANNARLVNLHHTSWDSRIHTSPSIEHHFKSCQCCHSHWANHKQILTWTELCQGLALSTCSGLPATWWHVKFLFVLGDPTSFTIKLIISKITQTKLSLLETCLQLAIWLYDAIYCFTLFHQLIIISIPSFWVNGNSWKEQNVSHGSTTNLGAPGKIIIKPSLGVQFHL